MHAPTERQIYEVVKRAKELAEELGVLIVEFEDHYSFDYTHDAAFVCHGMGFTSVWEVHGFLLAVEALRDKRARIFPPKKRKAKKKKK